MALTAEEVARLRIGLIQDPTGHATRRVVIIDETISGKFVLQGMPIGIRRLDGTKYWTESLDGIFLRDKSEISEI